MKILSLEEYNTLKKSGREQWLKYFFDLCNECNWKKKKLEKYPEIYNYTSPDTIIKNAKIYAIEYLNMTKEEITTLRMQANPEMINPRYNKLLNSIINTNDETEIEKLFLKEEYNMNELINKISQYIRVHKKDLSKQEQLDLEKEILLKLKPIIEKSKEIQAQKREIKLKANLRARDIETLEMFKEVVKNNTKVNTLMKSIDKKRYDRCLELLKEIDIELYQEYIKAVEKEIKEQKEETNIRNNAIKEIANYLINGIEDKDGLRSFDLVDFYQMYSEYANITYVKFNMYINSSNLNVEEKTAIKKFLMSELSKQHKIVEREKKSYIEGIDRINCEIDEKGYPIPNTGTIIPQEEKASWFEYLENNNIPVTIKTYNAMRKRYINNIDRGKKHTI